MSLFEAKETTWDYIIIGTGIGGSVFGLSLARAGKKVLFCEKGFSSEKLNATGHFLEMDYNKNSSLEFKKSGRRFSPIYDLSFDKPRVFKPFIGEGAGGSSLLYGMAMERGQATDFKSWPVSYSEMKHFYKEAEKLFNVKSCDTLHPQNKIIFDALLAKGLNPYKLPLASKHKNECFGCQGCLCNHDNKNHAGTHALREALNIHGTMLLDECEVQSLSIVSRRATKVIVKIRNETLFLKGENIVLAAGALETPRILFRSSNHNFPDGIANSSGQVGKNLMRHLIDLYVLDAKCSITSGATKQIAFNDLYQLPEGKGGTVQSFGEMPPIKVILMDLYRDLAFHSNFAKWMAQLASPFLSYFIKKKLSQSIVIASILEDSPCESNRVMNTKEKTSFVYHIQKQDKIRLKSMRNKMSVLLKSKLKMKIYSAEKNTLLAHACGTCRMGENQKKSVVDKNGRAHDIENLYIVDASIFPSSLGVNPALTIAANALRMANQQIMKSHIPIERSKQTLSVIEK